MSALRSGIAIAGLLLAGCAAETTDSSVPSAPTSLRIATYNIRELSTGALEDVGPDGAGRAENLTAAAEIVARIQPDVLIVQEIDHDYREPDDLALNARRLNDAYLALAGDRFPHVWAAPCNTGMVSGHDLNNDGKIATASDEGGREFGEDCLGFGRYPGQYSMALFSRFPIATTEARTFQRFLWKDLPGHHLPLDFYSPDEIEELRLSSKSHWDVPVAVDGQRLHLWISHPTPPVFDGEEDRNGRRNHDEIAFWKYYLDGDPALYDDGGTQGGFGSEAAFVIVGDLNADPGSDNAFYDGRQSIDLLLSDPRIADPEPRSDRADNNTATATFGGGVRVDYLLPSAAVQVTDGGVFWPAETTDPEGARLADAASDHRLVWMDVELPRLP